MKTKRRPVKYAKGLTKEELNRRKLGVRLARDVLAQLRVMKIQGGIYVGYSDRVAEAPKADQTEVAIRNCQVCAMGALFLQACRIDGELFPRAKLRMSAYGSQLLLPLRPAFSEAQLRLIEWAFEGVAMFSFNRFHENYDEVLAEMRQFLFVKTRAQDGTKQRLREVLRRVIRNGGVFLELGEGKKPGAK
jgi:hypothetical protein